MTQDKAFSIGHIHPQNGSWPVASNIAGFKDIWFYENNNRVLRTLRKNYPRVPIYLHPNALLNSRAEVPDMLGGSPPCAGFSQANPRANPDDPRNQETVLFGKLVEKFQPRAFMMEMVPTFYTTPKYRKLYDEFKGYLKGYKVNEEVVDLSMYGAPQKRKRYVIVGGKKDYIPFPTSTTLTSVRDALEGLPDLNEEDAAKKGLILGSLDENENDGIASSAKRGRPKKDSTNKTSSYEERQVKLEWDWIAPTMTSTAGKQFLHPEYNRTMTFRELARLMEFPDDFKFGGSITSQFRLLCEGVPCKALSLFLKEIYLSLKEGKN